MTFLAAGNQLFSQAEKASGKMFFFFFLQISNFSNFFLYLMFQYTDIKVDLLWILMCMVFASGF